jgi:ubiquinone/menaquinone biosynthesis C-methylase UbiE
MDKLTIHSIKARMQYRWRQQRMLLFLKKMNVKKGCHIIDLGGRPGLWEMVDLEDLNVTLLNLPDEFVHWQKNYKRHYHLLGDACHIPELADNQFDIVFSNSVIEHVGPPSQQAAFAKTVHRLAPRYWVQTPSIWFPIEAHCNLPFWWFYPQFIRQAWISRWQKQKREFAWKQMTTTRVLKLDHLKSLFPNAQVYTEYYAGFPKSYSMYK